MDVAAELLLGAACPGCGTAGFGLCSACAERLHADRPRPVRPTPCPDGFPRTVSGGPYDDLLHALIPAHKERQAWLLTRPLGRRLAGSVTELIMDGAVDGSLLLVPVPSSPAVVRSRGRDATAAIATAAARRLRQHLHRPVAVARLLRSVRRVADQSTLSESQRRKNLRGAYAVRGGHRRLTGTTIIVVDDLVTTGSTLTEASRALAAAGLPVHGAAVVAATRRRHPAGPSGRTGRRGRPES